MGQKTALSHSKQLFYSHVKQFCTGDCLCSRVKAASRLHLLSLGTETHQVEIRELAATNNCCCASLLTTVNRQLACVRGNNSHRSITVYQQVATIYIHHTKGRRGPGTADTNNEQQHYFHTTLTHHKRRWHHDKDSPTWNAQINSTHQHHQTVQFLKTAIDRRKLKCDKNRKFTVDFTLALNSTWYTKLI